MNEAAQKVFPTMPRLPDKSCGVSKPQHQQRQEKQSGSFKVEFGIKVFRTDGHVLAGRKGARRVTKLK